MQHGKTRGRLRPSPFTWASAYFFKVLFKKDYKVSSIDKNAFWAGFPDIILEKTPLSLLIEL